LVLIDKPVQARRGPATVMRSDPMYATKRILGKVWGSDDPESGELPVLQSPLNLRAIGRVAQTWTYITFVFMLPCKYCRDFLYLKILASEINMINERNKV